MALDLGTLVGSLAMDASAWIKGQDDAEERTKQFALNVPGYMVAVSAAFVALGTGTAVALYNVGATFDDVRDGIRVNTGAVGDELDGLVTSAERVGARVPAQFDAIGPAISTLNTRLGLSGDQLETVASQFLEAGRILGTDVDIQGATGAFNAFGVSNDQVSGKLDFLFQMSQATGIGINELIQGMGSAAPIVQQLGFSFEDTAALIGTMDRAGLDSQTMIGAMQKGLVNLTSPGESAQDAFKRVTGEIQGFIDSGDQAAAIDLAGQVFGTRGAAQFIGALSNGNLNLQDLIGSAGLSADTILGVGESTQDFGEKWDKFVNQMLIAFEPIGTRVFNFLGDAMSNVAAWAQPAFAWISENIPLLENIGAAVLAFGVTFTVLTAAVSAYNAITSIMRAVTTAGSIAQWALNVAMSANPVGLIVLAIAALIAIIVLLVMNWDAVVAWITSVWEGFVGWFTGVMDGFLGWWGGVWDGIIGFVQDVIANVVAWVTENWGLLLSLLIGPLGLVIQWVVENWGSILDFFQEVWANIVSFFTDALNAFVGFWVGVWTGISSFFTDLWNGLVSVVTGIFMGYVNWIMGIVFGFVSWWSDVWNGVLSFITGIWQSVSSAATTTWNSVISFLTGIPGKILAVFTGAGTMLYNIGTDILNGLWNGLKSIWENLLGWIGDIGENIADTFASVLGIASPSKVFRGFGVNIGEGLIDGLASMQPEIDARLEGMADATPTGPDGSISGSYNTSESRTDVTINVGSTDEAEELFDALTKGTP